MFSREFCEIAKNTFSYRTALVAASVHESFFFETDSSTKRQIFFSEKMIILHDFIKEN